MAGSRKRRKAYRRRPIDLPVMPELIALFRRDLTDAEVALRLGALSEEHFINVARILNSLVPPSLEKWGGDHEITRAMGGAVEAIRAASERSPDAPPTLTLSELDRLSDGLDACLEALPVLSLTKIWSAMQALHLQSAPQATVG